MNNYPLRTDLALEAQEALTHTPQEDSGITVTKRTDKGAHLQTTHVQILTENAARKIGKPKGNYITLESPALETSNDREHRILSRAIATNLVDMLPLRPNYQTPPTILVVGLGNRNVTPDSLGPLVIDHLAISRHLYREYGQSAFTEPIGFLLSGIVPGVMAQTGMETSEIVKGIITITRPALCIVIDALAARSIKRLNRTIQLSDTGIHPGSGVGNHRHGLTKETLGIPVFSLGIPTVVDAATIVSDVVSEKGGKPLSLPPSLHSMFVTPKSVDETILRLSFTLSEAINLAFGPHFG
ncbi:MAG: GPR endopeptidase [Lachnospiraceae bacterium]|jgi:spore protease|nr:GPR endopeptidase [Lachnospiraceae bacterium]